MTKICQRRAIRVPDELFADGAGGREANLCRSASGQIDPRTTRAHEAISNDVGHGDRELQAVGPAGDEPFAQQLRRCTSGRCKNFVYN